MEKTSLIKKNTGPDLFNLEEAIQLFISEKVVLIMETSLQGLDILNYHRV
jgi:hypothetical protein